MPTFLVPIAGSTSDETVLETAATLARPLSAHLELMHVHIGPAEAARHTPSMGYARGQAAANALVDLKRNASARADAALENVAQICARLSISLVDAPGTASGPTARWRLEEGDALDRLLKRSRSTDLLVVGRTTKANGLPASRLETLLLQSGRPIVLPGTAGPLRTIDTIVICWKECAEAARALGAARPFLRHAKRVVALSVEERAGAARPGLDELTGQLAWDGLKAEGHAVPRGARAVQETLLAEAEALGADLLVMGGYGRSPMAEILFGGCTQRVLEAAPMAVLMMH